jgi:obg-like ATPase 1
MKNASLERSPLYQNHRYDAADDEPRSFFTTGTDEVRQWTIRKGTKAPQAAGVIHTDFEKTFIQCIVFNFEVLKELGDEAAVKQLGRS